MYDISILRFKGCVIHLALLFIFMEGMAWPANARSMTQLTDTVADTIAAFATVFPEGTDGVGKATKGGRIFADHDHVFANLPPFLLDTYYLVGSMANGNRVVPVTEGSVLVVTPLAGQAGSQEESLFADGFARVEYPSFKLFEGQDVEIGVFKKEIVFQQFRLGHVEYDGWAVPFFKAEALPSVTVPAQFIWSPGEKYAIHTRLWQGCPSIEQTGKRLWGAWFSGGTREPDTGNYGIVSYSDDGMTWIDPAMVIVHPDSNVRVMDTQLWTDPNGSLWVFWVQNTGRKGFDGIWGTWAVRIDDPESDYPTWTPPRRLCHGLTRNKPIVLSTGEWLLPSYDWINHQSAVYVSCDNGGLWTLQGGPINPPVSNFYEHMCVELANGDIWMLQRNVQGSISVNKGKDWTSLDTIREMTSANSRVYIGRLRSGNLLLVYNDDSLRKTRKNLTAFLSKDDGKTWPYRLLLDERDEVSYPDAAESEDGLIYVCYDRSRTGEKEILLTTFTEADLIAGEFASSRASKRIIISKVDNTPDINTGQVFYNGISLPEVWSPR